MKTWNPHRPSEDDGWFLRSWSDCEDPITLSHCSIIYVVHLIFFFSLWKQHSKYFPSSKWLMMRDGGARKNRIKYFPFTTWTGEICSKPEMDICICKMVRFVLSPRLIKIHVLSYLPSWVDSALENSLFLHLCDAITNGARAKVHSSHHPVILSSHYHLR